MIKKIFLIALTLFFSISIIWLFANKIKTNIKNIGLKENLSANQLLNNNLITNSPNIPDINNKIFSQIEGWVSLEKLSFLEIPKNPTKKEKQEIGKKIVKSITNEAVTSQEQTLLEEFEKELASRPDTICMGTTGIEKGGVKGIAAEPTNQNSGQNSSSQNQTCEGNANSSNCSQEQSHYNDQNLTEEGGWGYSTGGSDATTCCGHAQDTQDCGEGTVYPKGQCKYSGEIRKDGPIIKNVKCCSGCCEDCDDDCCDDCGCCVASCERKCLCRGYRAYIWNSSTKECGCAN